MRIPKQKGIQVVDYYCVNGSKSSIEEVIAIEEEHNKYMKELYKKIRKERDECKKN